MHLTVAPFDGGMLNNTLIINGTLMPSGFKVSSPNP
jgi:hypothetical protein